MNARRLKKAMLKSIRTLKVTRGEKRALLAEPGRACRLVYPDHPEFAPLMILLRKYVVDAPPGVDARKFARQSRQRAEAAPTGAHSA